MFLGFKSGSKLTAVLAGIALFVVASGAWAYQFGFDRLSTLIALGRFSDEEIAIFLVQYRNSFLFFLLALFLLLLAVAGTSIAAARARRKDLESLVHWMRHRGCPVEEDHALTLSDGSMDALVEMIEGLFTKDGEGGAVSHKEELEELKSRFIEIITHQLQTPLTSVRWNLETMLAEDLGKLNRKQKELLSITEKNHEGILSMITDWIEALDVERGFLRMNMEALELRKYVDLVLEDYRHQVDTKDLKVTEKISRDLPLVRADKAKLLFVLRKLVHNAITYTPTAGAMEIRARKTGDYVRVEVQDSGVGIPYEEQKWIFKKFFRASNATLIEPNASGIGLFVAKRIVEAFGGQIAFNSEVDVGTTFIFTIPVAGPAEGIIRHKISRKRRPAKKLSKKARRPLSKTSKARRTASSKKGAKPKKPRKRRSA